MALVRRNRSSLSPMRDWNSGTFGDLFDEVDRFFNQATAPVLGQFAATTSYPVDLYETEENIVLEMAVPGVRVEDLDISIEGRQLSIRGTLPERELEGRRYWLQNIPQGQFSRTITLPATVEVDHIEARVHDGLLVLTMPKVAEARARKIAISNS